MRERSGFAWGYSHHGAFLTVELRSRTKSVSRISYFFDIRVYRRLLREPSLFRKCILDRVAIFVDAGYLFAQGSALLSGGKKPRAEIAFDARKAVDSLFQFATARSGYSLLRLYWYDGSIGGGNLTLEQSELAQLDHVKLRLGFINNFGQQKGVDSLIVTDLIELARQKAICDAVLLSGDEDVRIGVQIAQNYGVRVHLLGVKPSRGSQSQQLIWEADTTSEWGEDVVGSFLSIRHPPTVSPTRGLAYEGGEDAASIARTLVAALHEHEIQSLPRQGGGNWPIPSDQDAKLLTSAGRIFGRELDAAEKRALRAEYRRLVRERTEG